MNVFGRAFEPTGATQSVANDGTDNTITLTGIGDVNSSVHLVVVGTETVFVRLDGVAATTAAGIPLVGNGNTQVFSMPVGSTTVRAIGTAGSTLYVTPGRGV